MSSVKALYKYDQSLRRVEDEWSLIAGERVKLERISGNFYAYGSELACLRLFHRFAKNGVKHVRCEYSENLNTHYFKLEAL